MTYHYMRCLLCKKVVVDYISDYMTNHLDVHHPEQYKKLINEQRKFDIGYAKLKEEFPLAQRGTLNYFEYYPDKHKLTDKEKQKIKVFSYETELK